MDQSHWYSNPEWWAFAISAIALASSLGPIVWKWRRARIEVEIYDYLFLSHNIGNPVLFLNVLIRNVGGRDLRLSKLLLRISRNGREIISIPGSRYYDKPNDQQPVVFMSAPLDSGAEWSHSIQFFPPFDRETEDAFRSASNAIQEDIIEKRVALPPQAEQQIVRADDRHVAPLLAMFQRLFIWTRGEYRVTLEVETRPATASTTKFQFTLYESDETALRNLSEKFATGEGVYWSPPQPLWLSIPISKQ